MFRKIKVSTNSAFGTCANSRVHLAGQYKFLAPYWDPISADAKDFVSKLLTVDWRKRMTAQEALNHKWLREPSASAQNLFEGTAAPALNGPHKDGSPREVEAPPVVSAAAGGAANGMQSILSDYQLHLPLTHADRSVTKNMSPCTVCVLKFSPPGPPAGR
eukprot:scaffold221979_cov33-Tisochrysis_lutea.AAC.2